MTETEVIADLEAYVDEWRDTALANGQDLTTLRRDLREYIAWLNDPSRGPVAFRSDVVARLRQILAQ